jgi:ATP-dependent phosphofructokinase / diphosphate-dependent phosphofructokinase
MVTLVRRADTPYAFTTGLAPLAAIANQTRPMPADFVGSSATASTTPAYAAYATPLLGGPLPIYVRLLSTAGPPMPTSPS